MEKWIKVYDEQIESVLEEIDIENYKIWINDILDDEAIPYKNEIRYVAASELRFNDGSMILEVYVQENFEERVIELIREYKKASLEESIELNLELEELEDPEKYIANLNFAKKEENVKDYTDVQKQLGDKLTTFKKYKSKCIKLACIIALIIIVGICFVLSLYGKIEYLKSVTGIFVIFAVVYLIMTPIVLALNDKKYKKLDIKNCTREYLNCVRRKKFAEYNYSASGMNEEYFKNTLLFRTEKDDFEYDKFESLGALEYNINGKEIKVGKIKLLRKRSFVENMFAKVSRDYDVVFDGIFIQKELENNLEYRMSIKTNDYPFVDEKVFADEQLIEEEFEATYEIDCTLNNYALNVDVKTELLHLVEDAPIVAIAQGKFLNIALPNWILMDNTFSIDFAKESAELDEVLDEEFTDIKDIEDITYKIEKAVESVVKK
ncbi:MAG: hypothetical protein IKK43_04040 [Clostridia bacterium]|nr:hypothetical protein [Clostridia bacterium]